MLSVLSLEYCCPIAFWKVPDFYCLWTIASMRILCSVMSKRGYIYQKLNNWYENFNSLCLWVLITCYHRFVAVHNCIFLYITLGTKPKLAAQWEIIPNKSPINSWWIHASSEKEEDELDWCTRWCFLHGHWRNQVGILVFSEDLRGGFFWFVFLVGCCSADFVVIQGSLQQICCYRLYTGTTAGDKVGKSCDIRNHVWCAWACTCIPEKADSSSRAVPGRNGQ